MPELLLELFSEEIPARMQARGAEDLARLTGQALAPLGPHDVRTFSGPRRIALVASVTAGVAETRQSERGPRLAAPEQALAGFLRKHGATREQLREEGDFWVLDRIMPGERASALIARELPVLLRRFPWPKSMRWGGSSAFTWVRPLRRILCILDGAVVPFDLRHGDDDGHGLASGNLSEGHRFLSPGAFAVASAAQWQAELRACHVIADAAERRALVAEGIAAKASEHGLTVVEDAALLDEVAGLVEWPVPLLGRIDPAYMELPAEVMQVSMRVNQRYFALRDAAGAPAPWFAFAANVVADDGGAAIIAGNERVLRARFSDARHFWDLDRRTRLVDRVPALDAITFHAKLGSQGDRVRRLVRLAGAIAPLVGASVEQAQRAALLAKADLTTGMVGEFPELQGVMGRYYALHDDEDRLVADAVRDHYAPRGPDDAVPRERLTIAVALADKLDQLVSFFEVGEKPTGSGDPFALRRAALGLIRIILDNNLDLATRKMLRLAGADRATDQLFEFLSERLRVQLRSENARHDVLAAVQTLGDDVMIRTVRRTFEIAGRLGEPVGRRLLEGYRRAANLVRVEVAKDGPHEGAVDPSLFVASEERTLFEVLQSVGPQAKQSFDQGKYEVGFRSLSHLPEPLDRFFENVSVNNPNQRLRRNRLRLLASVRDSINQVADFSKIEG